MNSFIKTSSIFFFLTSTIILFVSIDIKFFYIDEEKLNIPIVSSDNENIKIKPEIKKENSIENDLEIEILNDDKKNDKGHKLFFNENKPELIPFEVANKKNNKKEADINNLKKTLEKDENNADEDQEKTKSKSINEKNLQKYRVQLGSFKSKSRAIKAIKKIETEYAKYFQNIKLEIYILKKDNFVIHRVWTNLMKKKVGLNLCNELKKNKVNCILQVEKN